MERTYKPQEFEKKWQDKWFSELSYEGKDLDDTREKYYLLVEFPYPSGDSMHMGHTRNYSMFDALARLRRMKGQNVMFPMGWDAFGLPTENYAIKVKRAPQDITKENIDTFRRQLKSLGLTFDWSREVNTTDPEYYKWTQWIFLKLYEKGLAYKAKKPINWCPNCKVGCANEEVVDGKHERCGTEVEQKNMDQWVLKITEYADRLDKDLDLTDYLDSVKTRQRNWIDAKTWYDIKYQVEGTDKYMQVSTTRPDTQFGATFVVVAPEHPILQELMDQMPESNREEVKKYIEATKRRSDLERVSESKDKTGAFTGLYCVNSISNSRMPIYTADFVLANIGTGMVVGVPAHDKRDFDFAQKFNIPVIRVIEGPDSDRSDIKESKDVYTAEGIVYGSDFMNGLGSEEARVKAAEYIKEKGIGDTVRRYHLQDWIFSRQHYWGEPIPIVHCPECGAVAVPESQLPIELPYVKEYEPSGTGESPLAAMVDWVSTKCPKCGGDAKRETDTMPNWAGSSWYFIRYADPHNTKAIASPELMKYWLPVDMYEGGQEHVNLHLLYSRFWHKFLYDQGIVPTPEPYQKRTIHGMVLGEGGVKMSKSLGNVISPDDLINKYGADVTRAYMMFMGPYEGDVVWSAETINGVKRFVSKYYSFILDAWDNKQEQSDEVAHKAVAKLLKRIEENLLSLKFNTSISALMEFYNEFSKNVFSKEDIEKLIIAIAPSLPHMAEELWNLIGHEDSVCSQPWPNVDEKLLSEDIVEVPVQINGKVRGRITISTKDTENVIKEKVLSDQALLVYLNGGEIKKFIYVPNKIINVVI